MSSGSKANKVLTSLLATLGLIVLVAGCGSIAALPDGDPESPDSVQQGDETSAAVAIQDAGTPIEVVVLMPTDWPNPIYAGSADLVVEASNGEEFRTVANRDQIAVQLPSPGQYSIGAIIEDGGCYDTAGVAQSGNLPVQVGDGDVVQLRDTGEICD